MAVPSSRDGLRMAVPTYDAARRTVPRWFSHRVPLPHITGAKTPRPVRSRPSHNWPAYGELGLSPAAGGMHPKSLWKDVDAKSVSLIVARPPQLRSFTTRTGESGRSLGFHANSLTGTYR